MGSLHHSRSGDRSTRYRYLPFPQSPAIAIPPFPPSPAISISVFHHFPFDGAFRDPAGYHTTNAIVEKRLATMDADERRYRLVIDRAARGAVCEGHGPQAVYEGIERYRRLPRRRRRPVRDLVRPRVGDDRPQTRIGRNPLSNDDNHGPPSLCIDDDDCTRLFSHASIAVRNTRSPRLVCAHSSPVRLARTAARPRLPQSGQVSRFHPPSRPNPCGERKSLAVVISNS